jgi:hypothetical protein
MGWVLAGVQSGCVATVGAEKKCPISFPAAISTSASFNKTLVRITHNNIIHSVAIMYVYALARAFAGSFTPSVTPLARKPAQCPTSEPPTAGRSGHLI